LKSEKEVVVLVHGKDEEDSTIIVGMGALQYFTVIFEGINQVFSMSEDFF